MKLATSLVAVKKINCSVPRSNFADEEIDQAAKLILQLEGIINPLVLQKTSLDSYEVVSGGFEYHAAVRARELDPFKGETIAAFVIDPRSEDALEKNEALEAQIQALREKPLSVAGGSAQPSLANLETRLKNLEDRIEARMEELRKEQVENRKQLESLFKQKTGQSLDIDSLLPALERIPDLIAQLENLQVAPRSSRPSSLKSFSGPKLNLKTAETQEIQAALKQVGVAALQIEAAIAAIHYWKDRQNLSWQNLEQSASPKSGAEHKIKGFASGTLKALKEVSEMPGT
jgi:hypothetical protein